jgi:hypothetical protein
MKCDSCGKDFSIWGELFCNGKYVINKLNGDKIKMLVCENCLSKEEENKK